MLHFDVHTLSMKGGEYFENDNIYVVNFDSGICIFMEYIHVKEWMTPIKFYTSNFNFCVKIGINGPLYCEICLDVFAVYCR